MSSPYLKPGDQVALVCTGTPCESEHDARVSADYLREHLGLTIRYQHDTYQALSAPQRFEIFMDYLADPSLRAIWSVRGGEGTADLIPFLVKQHRAIANFPPKLLIGFSDFTPMLVYFRQQYGWPTLHGVGSRQLPRKMVHQPTQAATLAWLSEAQAALGINRLQPLNRLAFVEHDYRAEVIGGNLTLLGISVADDWQLRPAGRIILLEEVNEEPYKVARTLKYLTRIKFFDGAVALLLGGFDFPGKTTLENQQRWPAMLAVLREFAANMPMPVFYTDEVGHGSVNLPVPFDVIATLRGGLQASCTFR